jgi:hypothetical protein
VSGFRLAAPGVDVDELMRQVRATIAEKKRSLYTEDELREIAERPLEPVIDAHDFHSGLLGELLGGHERWNYTFGPDTVYRSSRGAVGRALAAVRGALRPVQKLFWNPTPMISALSRQSDLNATYVHLLHNLSLAVTRQSLEIHDLKNRMLQLQGRLDLQARREKALESLLAEARGAATPGGEAGGAG